MTFTIELDGQSALVTGAGQGVGEAIARGLAAAGAQVFVNDVVLERADAVASGIRSDGGAARAVQFDVTDRDSASQAIAGLGPVDILVNNAGNAGVAGWNFASFADTPPSEWDRYLQVNLVGVMNCTHAVLDGMIARERGRVVTIISDAARFGDSHMAPYAAAKAGAAGFTRAVAREVGRFGITANNVALGSIRAEIPEPDRDPARAERDDRLLKSYIIRRFGRPSDVAPVVVLLASPLSSWITGQTIPVNGGYTLAL